MSDDFSRALARTAVGQLAELAGFEAVQDSAAEVLADLLIKYTTEIGVVAHGYAELANRTNVNLHDLLTTLDDLGTSVPELQTYLNALSRDDNAFAHALTDYPIRKPARVLPTWQDRGEEPPAHIPAFLPAFPDKHTYQRTPTFPGHDTHPDKQAQAIQRTRKQAETALLNLHHSTIAAARTTSTAAAAAATAAQGNPFLAAPSVAVVAVPGGGGIQGTGAAYEPKPASKAFGAVLKAAADAAEGAAGEDGAGGGADGDLTFGMDDLMAPEELTWRFEARVDEKGAPKLPLGTATDYTTQAFNAAHTYAVGQSEPDAFEEAAREEEEAAVGGRAGLGRKRKKAPEMDPVKKKALEVLERAKDPNAAADAGDE